MVAYSKLRIDFEYIVELLQGVVDSFDLDENRFDESEWGEKLKIIREVIAEYEGENPKLSFLLTQIVDEMEHNKDKFIGQDISVLLSQMRHCAFDAEIRKYAEKWHLKFEDVKYEVYNFRNG